MAVPFRSVVLVVGSRFTEEEAGVNRDLVNPDVYPALYGDELPKELKLVSRSTLVETSAISKPALGSLYANPARVEDGNPKKSKIQNSIAIFNFKLKHPGIALFRDKDGRLYLINGKTRHAILVSEWDYQNVIADIYEANEGFSDDEVAYAIHIFGQASNLDSDPAGETTMEDLFDGCNLSIRRGWITKDKNGVPEESSIEEHLKKICRDNKLTPKTMETLVQRVVGQWDEKLTGKRYWGSKEDVVRFIEGKDGSPMKYVKITPKYDDNDNCVRKGIKYMVFETSEYRRAFGAATKWAHKNPDYEVRIIYYRHYIKANEPQENFIETLKRNDDHWSDSLSEIKDVHFSAQCKIRTNRCYIYGAVPSLRSLHDLNKLIFLDAGGNWSQR